MENITLNTPYKIIISKHKRYTSHYQISAAESVIVPRKKYGDQMSCDVWWKDVEGETRHKSDLIFDKTYLEPLNPMVDFILFGVWENANKEVTL
jgi:hypothetical protein